jgi:hypothetical protein
MGGMLMISPENFVLYWLYIVAFGGVFNILCALLHCEKPVKTHYGIVDGAVGLIAIGVVFAMVVI